MIWNRVFAHFLTGIFAVPFDQSYVTGITNASIIGRNENESPIRHVFNCPSEPLGGCPKSKGCLYADPDNCHHYYKCVNGNAKRKDCPDNGHGGRLQWDDIDKKCIQRRGRCPVGTVTTSETSTTTAEPTTITAEPTTITAEPTTTTAEPTTTTAEPTTATGLTCQGYPCSDPNRCYAPDPTDCNKFIQCVPPNGTPMVMTCPFSVPPLQWNQNTKLCEFPPSPTCQTKTAT